MLTHWYKGLTGGFRVEFGGATFRVEVGRAQPSRYAEVGTRVHACTPDAFRFSEKTRPDGELWHRVEHARGPMSAARCLWFRAGYSELARDDRMLVLIDAPKAWRVTWQDPDRDDTPRAAAAAPGP